MTCCTSWTAFEQTLSVAFPAGGIFDVTFLCC